MGCGKTLKKPIKTITRAIPAIGGATIGGLIGGPPGAAAGAGLAQGGWGLVQGKKPLQALGEGALAAGLAYAGGNLFAPEAAGVSGAVSESTGGALGSTPYGDITLGALESAAAEAGGSAVAPGIGEAALSTLTPALSASVPSSMAIQAPAQAGGSATPIPGPTGGGPMASLKKWGMPLSIFGGTNLLGSLSQSSMLEDLAEAQQQSYSDYLSTINPPESVKATRLSEAESKIRKAAPAARRGLESRLAGRGIRGRGTAAPIAGQERSIQDALNQAYFDIYGDYNVPSAPGPANFAPSTGQLFGSNLSQIGNYLLPLWMLSQGGFFG